MILLIIYMNLQKFLTLQPQTTPFVRVVHKNRWEFLGHVLVILARNVRVIFHPPKNKKLFFNPALGQKG